MARSRPPAANAVATPRGAALAAGADPLSAPSLQSVNVYDRGRVAATCDDKRMAAVISGHTWNILNNREDHELYLRHARNADHYIDESGKATHHWFEKKGRVDLDKDGVIDSVDSSNVQEVMLCPGTAGKRAADQRGRQARQLCQVAAPRDYARYRELRAALGAVPPTPRRLEDAVDRRVAQQDRMRDRSERPTPRVVEKNLWTPRRAEPRVQQVQPPSEQEMFQRVEQLRSESHVNTSDRQFAEAIASNRGGADAAAAAAANAAGACPSSARGGSGSARGGGSSARGGGESGAGGALPSTGAQVLVAGRPSRLASTAERITAAPPGPALLSASAARSAMPESHNGLRPALAHERTRFSGHRAEQHQAREITGWPFSETERLKREDAFYVRPVQATGSSSVKYNIVTGERHGFFY
eukprot:TRINITY_DN5406_c1_g2_i1.p1 TRINITY_DN5406_c1_g2~~TRINITY_DN5406_c1_g2_i1.p1  ORF type:complete len:475 (-),score=89.60 TRINITY_DN5406_c1_g2_i1:51-1295(-)